MLLDAVVVGGGPVGLFLACALAQRGLRFAVLEQHQQPRVHSRAIGLHPPALGLLGDLGVAEQAIARGVAIRRGVVRGERGVLGELEFGRLSPYPFVLALPQADTELLLEARLHALSPGALRRGARVVQLESGPDEVALTYQAAGANHQLRCRYVIGADGCRSLVRQQAGIAYSGGPYRDRYVMGDFDDATAYEDAAVIHVARDGVVESFPLPQGTRRWVVRVEGKGEVSAQDLSRVIYERTNHRVPAASCRMLSPFGVARHLAAQFVVGRSVLVGDAAHEISPIGGQGMNLGLMDAAALARALGQTLGGSAGAPLREYQQRRRRAAVLAARQAEFNMLFGQSTHAPLLREQALKVMLSPPLRPLMARLFTMRWLA